MYKTVCRLHNTHTEIQSLPPSNQPSHQQKYLPFDHFNLPDHNIGHLSIQATDNTTEPDHTAPRQSHWIKNKRNCQTLTQKKTFKTADTAIIYTLPKLHVFTNCFFSCKHAKDLHMRVLGPPRRCGFQ